MGCRGEAVEEEESWFFGLGGRIVDVDVVSSRGEGESFVWCWDGHFGDRGGDWWGWGVDVVWATIQGSLRFV